MTPATPLTIAAPPPRIFVQTLFLFLILSLSAAPVSAADIEVSGNCSLAEAIENANDGARTNTDCATGSSGADTINLTGNVMLPDANALAITSTLTINGGDYTLSGTGSLLHVSSPDTNTRTLTINNLTLTNNNNSTASGHALRVDTRALATINDSIFEKNTSTNSGAAISVGSNGRSVTINDSIFRNNTSGGSGGAIQNYANSIMTINGSLFANNTASFSGGAIYDDLITEIYRSVFSGNSAGSRGGAIFTERTLYIENSTLFNNSSGSDGGAVAGLPSSTVSQLSGRIRHVTFVDNSATGAGNSVAIQVHHRHTVRMFNSIIKRKSGATGNDCVGLETSGYNIIEDGSCANSSNLTKDPLLGTRSSGTLFYFPLRHNSPARDAANDDDCTILRDENGTDVDQRAAVRPYPVGGACDIGAYEWYPPPPPPPLPEPDDTEPNCRSLPARQARYGQIGSEDWRRHFARLGIRAQNAAAQAKWSVGEESVSGINACFWDYECSTDAHWAYGHYYAKNGHNYLAPGSEPPPAVRRMASGKFNLCYSAWKNGCDSTEAWEFGWESGIQIFNRWYRRSAAAILCEP